MAGRSVALVVGQLQVGGAEGQLFHLATRLDPDRYAPFVVCLSEVAEPFASRLRRQGIDVEIIARRGHYDLARVRILARLLRARRTELVHSFLLAANAYAYGAILAGPRGRRKPPFIASSRTCIPPRGMMGRAIHRRAFRAASAVIANSKEVRKFTAETYGLEASRIHVIPNGVAAPAVAPEARGRVRAQWRISEATVVVGTLGRLSPEKNLELFLELARSLEPPPGISVVYVIVGDGPARDSLERRAAALGLSDGVVFAGMREDVADTMAAMDIFVTASSTEGLPNAVMEAMSAGLPTIATDVGGTGEVVRHEETGFLVQPGSLSDLVRRGAELLVDPEARRRLGAAGRDLILSEFSVGKMVDRTMALYDEVMA